MIQFTMMMLHESLIDKIKKILIRERKNRRIVGLMWHNFTSLIFAGIIMQLIFNHQ